MTVSHGLRGPQSKASLGDLDHPRQSVEGLRLGQVEAQGAGKQVPEWRGRQHRRKRLAWETETVPKRGVLVPSVKSAKGCLAEDTKDPREGFSEEETQDRDLEEAVGTGKPLATGSRQGEPYVRRSEVGAACHI